MKKYFVAGTDTDAGKSYVLSLMLKACVAKRVNVGVMKPIETGCKKLLKTFVPSDALMLSKLLKKEDELGNICPVRFAEPVAPFVAAQVNKKPIDVFKIKTEFEKLSKNCDVFFVEAAGGLLVPVTNSFMMIDFPRFLGLDVILVSRLGLGAINHTLLSIEALKKRKISIAGVIFSDTNSDKNLAKKTNPEIVQKFSGVPVLAVVKHNAKKISAKNLWFLES